jgi:hypothetical protein
MSGVHASKFTDASVANEQLSEIRYAAAFEFLCEPHEASLASKLGIDAVLVARKLGPEWDRAKQAIWRQMFLISPLLRHHILSILKDGSAVMQREAVRAVVDLTFPLEKHPRD